MENFKSIFFWFGPFLLAEFLQFQRLPASRFLGIADFPGKNRLKGLQEILAAPALIKKNLFLVKTSGILSHIFPQQKAGQIEQRRGHGACLLEIPRPYTGGHSGVGIDQNWQIKDRTVEIVFVTGREGKSPFPAENKEPDCPA